MTLKTIAKMGFKSLVSHPVRFIAVLLLTAFALGMLGVAVAAASFDEASSREQSLFTYEENYIVEGYDGLTAEAVSELSSLTGENFALFQDVSADYIDTVLPKFGYFVSPRGAGDFKSDMMTQYPGWIVFANAEWMQLQGFIVEGRLPETVNEIALSVCQYRLFESFGYYDYVAASAVSGAEYNFDDSYVREVSDMQTFTDGSFHLYLKSPEGGKTIEATVVGIVDYGICKYNHTDYPISKTADCYDNLYVSEEYFSEYSTVYGNSYINCAVAAKGKSVKENAALYALVEESNVLVFRSSVLTKFDDSANLLNTLKNSFLYAGIGLALFCAGLIFQFISFSLESRKEEIGILRALGAGKADIYRIFLTESLFLSIMQATAGLVFAVGMTFAINSFLVSDFGIPVIFVTFSILPGIIIFSVSIFVSFIAAFIPIKRTADRVPAEAIRVNSN